MQSRYICELCGKVGEIRLEDDETMLCPPCFKKTCGTDTPMRAPMKPCCSSCGSVLLNWLDGLGLFLCLVCGHRQEA